MELYENNKKKGLRNLKSKKFQKYHISFLYPVMFLTFEVLLLVEVLDLVVEFFVLWFDVPDPVPDAVTIIVPVIDGCIEQ